MIIRSIRNVYGKERGTPMTSNRKLQQIIQFLLILLLLYSLTACGKENEEPEPSPTPTITATPTTNPSELPDQASIDWFYALFPDEIKTTLFYVDGSNATHQLTLSNIEIDTTAKTTEFIFEGESTTENLPTLLYETYEVGTDGVFKIIGDQKLPLLKTKLVEGAMWDGLWYDATIGLFHANFSLSAVSDKSVVVTIKPIADTNAQTPTNWSMAVTLEKGTGISKIDQTANGISQRQSKLSKISSVPPANYVSRFVQPGHALAQLSFDPYLIEKMHIQLSQWKKTNGAADDTAKMAFIKAMFLPWENSTQLDRLDLPIAAAKQLVMQLAPSMKEPDQMINWFITFYETYVNNRFDLVERLNPNTEDWLNELYTWKDGSFTLLYKPLDSLYDPQSRAVSIILQQNGFQLTYSEGWGYFTTKPGFITEDLATIASPSMAKWITLLDWEVQHYPIADDGGLIVSYQDLIDHMIALEEYEAMYPKSAQSTVINDKIHFYLETLLVPTDFFPNTPLYEGGKLNSAAQAAYAYAVETYPQSRSAIIIRDAQAFLKKSKYSFSSELYQYLLAQGFTNFSETIAKSAEQESQQMKDHARLKDLPASPPSESSGNMVTITVNSAESLLKAIGSNRYIKLKTGDYTLPSSWSGNSVTIVDGECTIGNVSNLVIIGDESIPATIRSEAYGYLFVFNECKNIRLENIRMGHLQEFCRGGVIGLRYCDGFVLDNSILFGCGYWGLDALNTKNLTINRTVISDCETRALELVNTELATITNCVFSRNGKTVVMMDNSQHINFESINIENNIGETDPSTIGAIFHLIGCENVRGRNLKFSGNTNVKQQLFDGEAMNIE